MATYPRLETFFIVSLGCPKNRVDSEMVAGRLTELGFVAVPTPEDADVIIVNTCGFLGSAREESVDTLLEMAEWKNRGRTKRLVAMGCMAQQVADQIERLLPEVDLIVGTGMVEAVAEALESPRKNWVSQQRSFLPDTARSRVLSIAPGFAYLKISDGCNRKCTFCTIPSIKGPYLSRSMDALVDEAGALADDGVKELVLVGQDLTQYGRPERRKLLRLLDRLEAVDGIEWIRCMYLYPEGLSDALLKRLGAGGKVLPYMDIPLQHVTDRILRRMKRATSRRTIEGLLDRARKFCPDITIRTTFIVGFPGETKKDFDELKKFVASARFHRMGVFAYSQEMDTPSAHFKDQIPLELREERRDELMELQQGISRAWNEEQVGKEVMVLVDGPAEDHDWVRVGRLPSQAPEVDGQVYLELYDGPNGQLVPARIMDAADCDLVARPLSELD